MKSDCKSCRKWKEWTYWSQFRVLQFFQILIGGFIEQLAIPQKFDSYMRETLGDSVSLTGPSGATWNVGLVPIGDTLFLKHGWKEFVEAHSLEEDDLLVFKYNVASKFDVSVFDRYSFCEKEASCFVKRCEHADVASESRTKRPIQVTTGRRTKMHTPETINSTSKSSSHGVYEGCRAAKKSKLGSKPTSSAKRSVAETSDSTSKSSSHEVYEGPPAAKKSKLASIPTSRAPGTRANAKLRSMGKSKGTPKI